MTKVCNAVRARHTAGHWMVAICHSLRCHTVRRKKNILNPLSNAACEQVFQQIHGQTICVVFWQRYEVTLIFKWLLGLAADWPFMFRLNKGSTTEESTTYFVVWRVTYEKSVHEVALMPVVQVKICPNVSADASIGAD